MFGRRRGVLSVLLLIYILWSPPSSEAVPYYPLPARAIKSLFAQWHCHTFITPLCCCVVLPSSYSVAVLFLPSPAHCSEAVPFRPLPAPWLCCTVPFLLSGCAVPPSSYSVAVLYCPLLAHCSVAVLYRPLSAQWLCCTVPFLVTAQWLLHTVPLLLSGCAVPPPSCSIAALYRPLPA